ncbi:uncharacterized protein BDV17DRAFT_291552 [Aspergillus undulatus]|uniref:uncharacterized protein n=1 Tax=Aspergillus undulatus TaxID=1810928 RepID=UPI003CCDA964
MPSLQAIRASNARLNTLPTPRITALFVGGTSGIGQSTLRQLAKHTNKHKPSPSSSSSSRRETGLTAYIVGRNEARAKPFLFELQSISPHGKFHFIEADVALARNVDRVCEEIKKKEEKLDYVFMTPGGISNPFAGRDDTIEGIDRLFALRYYSRMRFISNLLPLLSKSDQSRVISIYGGGFEYPIDTSNLSLSRPGSFNALKGYKHSITMTSLAMSHLSKQYPNVSFIHAFPGLVGTNIYSNSFPGPIAAVYNYAIWPMMWPFSVGLKESGERHLFHLASSMYPARNGGDGGVQDGREGEGEVANGLDGVKGSGAYLINWRGGIRPSSKILDEYREQGIDEMVWRHTEEVLDEAVRK